MIKIDNKIKSYMIIGAWSLYVIYLYIYRNKLVNIIITSGFFIGTVIYFLTNPAYLLLIYYIISTAKRSKIKATVASIIIVFALDITSFPRILMGELFSASPSAVSNMGAIAIKGMLNWGIPQGLAYFSYYLIFPIALMFGALELSGHINFIKNFKGGI